MSVVGVRLAMRVNAVVFVVFVLVVLLGNLGILCRGGGQCVGGHQCGGRGVGHAECGIGRAELIPRAHY